MDITNLIYSNWHSDLSLLVRSETQELHRLRDRFRQVMVFIDLARNLTRMGFSSVILQMNVGMVQTVRRNFSRNKNFRGRCLEKNHLKWGKYSSRHLLRSKSRKRNLFQSNRFTRCHMRRRNRTNGVVVYLCKRWHQNIIQTLLTVDSLETESVRQWARPKIFC